MRFLLVVVLMSSLSAMAMDVEGESAETLFRLAQKTFALDCSGMNCEFQLEDLECLGFVASGTTCTVKKAGDLKGPLLFGYDPAASAFANSLEELYFSGMCGTAGTFDVCLASSLACRKSEGVISCSVTP